MPRTCRIAFLAMMAVAVLAAPAHAAVLTGAAGATPDQVVQAQPVYDPQDTYGTFSQTVSTVRIEDIRPQSSTVAWTVVNTGGIYIFQSAGPQVDWWGRVFVPSGALIERLEMQACDTTATGQILFGMARFDAPASTGANVTPIGSTGTAATPGCAFFSVSPTAAVVADNRNNSYEIFVAWQGDFTTANKVAAFRVFYRLQISPDPATAQFLDVPVGHPQHRFVEALSNAGITGGCGSGNYCPDAALTRGQMAVFLSTALGLHFPN